MGLRNRVKNALNAALSRCGHTIVEEALLYDWQKTPQQQPNHGRPELPKGAEDYLREDHPRLRELIRRYSSLDSGITGRSSWADRVRPDDVRYFRGDNAYVWQLRGKNMNRMSYALTMYYVRSIDSSGLLDRMVEDECFGIHTFVVDNKVVSRDLLDSVVEVYFLEKHLGILSLSGQRILDIGAGYGRLAHRMLTALPGIRAYYCTDAIAVSTFISEYYIRYRDLQERARVVPLDEIEETIRDQSIDIAVNIHSFSECKVSSIDWWLSLLRRNEVRYLMIAPNALDHGGRLLLTNDRQDFRSVVERHGYRLVASEPKYRDPVVQEYAISPTYHHLFELR